MTDESGHNMIKTIHILPDEIILFILRNVDCCDVKNFSSTCKRFNEIVKSDECLWKSMFMEIVPLRLFRNVKNNIDGKWLEQTKLIYTVKRKIYNELVAMSPKCYLRTNSLSFPDVENFFKIALANSTSYFFTIHLLVKLLKTGKMLVNNNVCKKPFTLTEMYYAKLALRHLIHTFLCMKWVKLHNAQRLEPITVLNIFVQWADTDNIYLEEDIQDQIRELATEVVKYINAEDSTIFTCQEVAKSCSKCPKTQRRVLETIAIIIYQQRHMTLASGCNLETLDSLKVLKRKSGNRAVVAAIFEAVANELGVICELVVFPNHLFLEWQDNSQPDRPQYYTVDLTDGKLYPKRTCPFSDRLASALRQQYSPHSLIHYAASIIINDGRNGYSRNVEHLIDFLVRSQDLNNPYIIFHPFLLDHVHLPAMNTPLSMVNPYSHQLELMSTLTTLYAPTSNTYRPMFVKRRNGEIKFAVGMLCYDRKYGCLCVIRGWDYNCMVEWMPSADLDSLEYGENQPFYKVLGIDKFERYVAQENLQEFTPNRQIIFEDIICREFSHFDGFAYVPNDEKFAEYPEDYNVSNQYRNKHLNK